MVRFSARWDNGEMHPGHCSVFDCLQYAKMEGGGLVLRVGRQRWGGVPDQKNALCARITFFHFANV